MVIALNLHVRETVNQINTNSLWIIQTGNTFISRFHHISLQIFSQQFKYFTFLPCQCLRWQNWSTKTWCGAGFFQKNLNKSCRINSKLFIFCTYKSWRCSLCFLLPVAKCSQAVKFLILAFSCEKKYTFYLNWTRLKKVSSKVIIKPSTTMLSISPFYNASMHSVKLGEHGNMM